MINSPLFFRGCLWTLFCSLGRSKKNARSLSLRTWLCCFGVVDWSSKLLIFFFHRRIRIKWPRKIYIFVNNFNAIINNGNSVVVRLRSRQFINKVQKRAGGLLRMNPRLIEVKVFSHNHTCLWEFYHEMFFCSKIFENFST